MKYRNRIRRSKKLKVLTETMDSFLSNFKPSPSVQDVILEDIHNAFIHDDAGFYYLQTKQGSLEHTSVEWWLKEHHQNYGLEYSDEELNKKFTKISGHIIRKLTLYHDLTLAITNSSTNPTLEIHYVGK